MAKKKKATKKASTKPPKSSALRADTGAKQTKAKPISMSKRKPGKIKPQAISVQKGNKAGQLKVNPSGKNFSQKVTFDQKKKKTGLSKNPTTILHREALALHKEKRIEAAIACLERGLRLSPNNFTLLLDLGNILGLEKAYEQAEKYIRKAIELQPNHPSAHNSLASVLRVAKRAPEAIKELEIANKLKPNQVEVLLGLGEVLNKQKKYKEAEPYLIQAKKLAPKNAKVLTEMAKVLQKTKRSEEAVKLIEEALKINSNLISGLEAAVEICMDLQKFLPARQCLQKLVKLKPTVKRYAYSLAELMRLNHQMVPALSVIENYYKDVKNLKGPDYTKLGEYSFYAHQIEKAMAHFDKALALDPKIVEAYNFYGRCLSTIGDKEGAHKKFRKAIETNPRYLNPYFFIAEVGEIKANDPAFKRLEDLKKDKTLSFGEKGGLGFALGRMNEKTKNYKKAFENFKFGNDNANQYYNKLGFKYKPAEIEKNYGFKKTLFSKENLKKNKFKGSESTQPLFVLGLPRTGTTLFEQILSSHSQIGTAGELPDMTRIWNTLNAKVGKKGSEKERLKRYFSIMEKEGHLMAKSYLESLVAKGGKATLIVDKMPQNSLQLGMISVLFPKAKIIHMRRSPMDSGLSMYCNQLGGGWNFTRNLEHLGHQYQLNEDLMTYWKKTLDIPIHDVFYEELTDDPEKIAREALKFCGKKWQKQCLEFYKKDTEVFTSSLIQVRRPVNKGSVEKWKRYEKELQPLKKALGPLMK